MLYLDRALPRDESSRSNDATIRTEAPRRNREQVDRFSDTLPALPPPRPEAS